MKADLYALVACLLVDAMNIVIYTNKSAFVTALLCKNPPMHAQILFNNYSCTVPLLSNVNQYAFLEGILSTS